MSKADEAFDELWDLTGMSKLNADKMFDEIGFNKYEYNNKIEYLSRERSHEITFYKDKKVIDSRCGIGSEFISMKELQAINQKVKELGWNEQ